MPPPARQNQVSRATLQRIVATGAGQAGDQSQWQPDGDPVPVQFNPTSLRVSRSNNVDVSGETTGTQMRRQAATQSATLSVELEFDTAEEGGAPVDVNSRTALVRQFVVPPGLDRPGGGTAGGSGKGNSSTPPPVVRFSWGPFSFTGIVTQLDEDIDYFADDGTPLHAKLNVTIIEQDLRLQTRAGAAGRTATDATDPGGTSSGGTSGAGGGASGGASGGAAGGAGGGAAPPNTPAPSPAPGSAGTNSPRSIVPAQGGESAPQLAARLGGDPAAWRSLMTGLDGPRALPAGTPVQVGAELHRGTGALGRTTGFGVGSDESRTEVLARVLGLAPGAAGSVAVSTGDVVAGAAGLGARVEAGLALAAAGGVAAATATVRAAETNARTAAARDGFAVPAASARTAAATTSARSEPVTLDPRAQGYGRAVPLRAPIERSSRADLQTGGQPSIASRAAPLAAPPVAHAIAPPWERLPPAAERVVADQCQRAREARITTARWSPSGAYC